MFDVKRMLERQAHWQHLRANLSWTEKLRMAEILREAAVAMMQSRRKSDQQTDSETDDRRNNG